MADTYKWAEALNINAKKVNEWSVLAPDGVPLIVWLLQEGHVPADAYLRWASEHYEMPVLNPAYFSEAFDPKAARNIQADVQDEWRPWHFPVEQWDGLTLVTCVEPPTMKPAGHVRYVLADANVLAANWSKLTEMATESVILQMDKSVVMAQDEAPPQDEAAPPPIPDVPIGFNENTGTKPFKLNLDLSADLFGAKAENSAPAIPEPMPEPEPVPEPVSPPVKKVAKAQAPPVSPAPPVPAAPAPAAAVGEATQTVSAAMVELKQIFEHVFIMKCVGGVARLYKWDPTMKPKDGGKNIHVDLAFPTFLRIVHKTGMPYHGYLVDSPAHNDFFASLALPRPGCVTGVPIKLNGELIGVLVGTGGEELQKLDVLAKAEAMATKLTVLISSALAEAA